MADQLAKLLDAAQQPNITVRVLPATTGAHAGMDGAFVLLSLPVEPGAVFVEGAPAEVVDQGPRVRDYEFRFDRISVAALPPQESIERISLIARQIN